MPGKEQEIKQLAATGFPAAQAGDTNALSGPLAHTSVFLRTGEPVTRKDELISVALRQRV